MDRLEDIRQRHDNTTRGAWERHQTDVRTLIYNPYTEEDEMRTVAEWVDKANAEFIAHAHSDIPFLLETIEHLQRENERLTNALKHLASRYEQQVILGPGWELPWAMHSDAIQALEEGFEFGDRGYDERRISNQSD